MTGKVPHGLPHDRCHLLPGVGHEVVEGGVGLVVRGERIGQEVLVGVDDDVGKIRLDDVVEPLRHPKRVVEDDRDLQGYRPDPIVRVSVVGLEHRSRHPI
jgi:hypothetical protein